MTGHAVLQIVKGVQVTPGDTQSAERGLDSIDFLSTEGGFALDVYEIKIPSLKSSAVYADSPLTDGRTLISGTLGNVNETIRLTLAASTIVQLSAMLSKLLRFRQDCNDFWDTFVQIEPIYIKHQVNGEPGPRYALLYDIDIAVDTPTNPSEPTRDITIVVEREPYWRGIAPGDNPKHWTYIQNEQSQQWAANKANLLTGSDHLTTGTIQNRAELNSAVSGFATQNFIDIPAAKIPGDAPALLSLSVQQAVSVSATTLIVGKSTTKKTGNTSRNTGNNQLTVFAFNAGDSSGSGIDTTLAADTGAPDDKSGSNQRSVTTFGTATMQSRLTWFPGANEPNGFSTAVLRGRFMVYLRARVSAAASVRLQMSISVGSGADQFTTTPAVLSDLGAGGTGNSTDWALVYMGVVGVPFTDKRTSVGADGRGIWIDSQGAAEIQLRVSAARDSGAGSLYMSDLIFIPIDEGSIKIASSLAVGTGALVPFAWLYDNSGYFAHGTPSDYAAIHGVTASSSATFEADSAELSGGALYLTPGVDNRLYFLAYVSSTKRSFPFDPSASSVRVNIVPRWQGYRTE
jgi:hypothetical protein